MSAKKPYKKYRIRFNKPIPPPAEMDRHKNFKGVMTDYREVLTNIHRKPLYKNPKLFFGLVMLILIGWLVFEAVEEEELGRIEPETADSLLINLHGQGIDIPFHSVEISADSGGVIFGESDLKIVFPDSAFQYAGKTVSGKKVKIRYRVMYKATEFLIAGIKLNFPRAFDTTRILSPACIIEIVPESGESEIQIGNRKTVQILLGLPEKQATNPDLKIYNISDDKMSWLETGIVIGQLIPEAGKLPVDPLMKITNSDSLFAIGFAIRRWGIYNCGVVME